MYSEICQQSFQKTYYVKIFDCFDCFRNAVVKIKLNKTNLLVRNFAYLVRMFSSPEIILRKGCLICHRKYRYWYHKFNFSTYLVVGSQTPQQLMYLLFGQTVRTKGLEVLSWRRFVNKLYNYAPLNSPNCGCSGHLKLLCYRIFEV